MSSVCFFRELTLSPPARLLLELRYDFKEKTKFGMKEFPKEKKNTEKSLAKDYSFYFYSTVQPNLVTYKNGPNLEAEC